MKSKKVCDLSIGEVIAENIYRSSTAQGASGENPIVSAGVELNQNIINKLQSIFGEEYAVLIKEQGYSPDIKNVKNDNQSYEEGQPGASRVIDRNTAIQMYKQAFHNKEKFKYTKEKLVSVFKKIDGVMQDFRMTKNLEETTLIEVSNNLSHILTKKNTNFDPALIYVVEMESWDEVTFNHSFDVAVLALSFATAFTSSVKELASLFLAGLIHDIGKYLYSKFNLNAMDYIIKKDGRLSDEEYDQIKRHVDVEDFLSETFLPLDDRYRNNIIYGATEHHEKFTGGGYNKKKKGMEISFSGRLIAICDVYDAMLRERRYKHAMKPNLVMDFIKNLAEQGQFDPLMFKKFIRTFGKYPMGSVLKTNKGPGVVVDQTQDFERPIIFLPADGEIDASKDKSIEIEEERFEDY